MTNFLHWRKMTWVLLLWSAAMVPLLLVVGGSSVVLVGGLWVVGTTLLAVLWYTSMPLVQQGRGFRNGFFLRPSAGNWRLVNLHRTF